jgi:hypothetical protein
MTGVVSLQHLQRHEQPQQRHEQPQLPHAAQQLVGQLRNGRLLPLHVVEALAALAQQVGGALPLPLARNNPACAGAVGGGRVGEALRRCVGCQVAAYDCVACQRAHWRVHKAVCRRLAAAGAGAAELCRQRA